MSRENMGSDEYRARPPRRRTPEEEAIYQRRQAAREQQRRGDEPPRRPRPPQERMGTEPPRRPRPPQERATREFNAEDGRRRPRREEEIEVIYEQPMEPHRHRRGRRGSPWLWAMGGCGGALLLIVLAAVIIIFVVLRNAPGGPLIGPGQNTYTQKTQVPLPLAGVSQLTVDSQVGDVTVSVTPGITDGSVALVKQTRAASKDTANGEFTRITVQPVMTGNALTLTARVPSPDGLNASNDAVALNISLPETVNTPGGAPFQLTIKLSVGNVQVIGLNGVISVKNDAGNITARQVQIADGSSLRTANGNVLFNGLLLPGAAGTKPRYEIHSEVGSLDITIPATTDVQLDVNTNSGKIVSEFPLTITTSDSASSYFGPLLPGTTPAGTLKLDIGTGTINLHKGS